MKQSRISNSPYWRINLEDLPMMSLPDSSRQDLITGVGNGHTLIYPLDPDITFLETKYQPSTDLAIRSHIETQAPRMVITLALQGHSCFSSKQGGDIIFKQGYTTITTFNSSIGERRYQGNLDITQLRFSLSQSWLQHYCGEALTQQFFHKRGITQLIDVPISHVSLLAAKVLSAKQAPANLTKLFRYQNALTIICCELNRLCEAQSNQPSKFNYKDREMADVGREILYQEFRNAPTMAELARRLGTNQLKLKQLFQHFFNDTPYGLLTSIRMQKAYQKLQAEGCQVSVAADFVGYGHASNFSLAFTRYFGVSPKAVAHR